MSPAPLGNTNRLKHGIYTRPVLPFGSKDASRVPITDLSTEIVAYQDYIRQYGQSTLPVAYNDLETGRKTLFTLAYAVNQLASLVRSQHHAQLFTSNAQALEKGVASLPSAEEPPEEI